ncbi:hypothetical protein AB0B15_02940 [Streptomyces sp. NPDC045456]|uniref:hypothetical protein n=1 Tax=Streptomyces sp. NPDC045456 TaxID=3155254 RepID=UPI0033F21AB4
MTVVNNLHPTLSGERTVHAVQPNVLKTMVEGCTDPWVTRWPSRGEWRIVGDTLHYVDPENTDTILFSYTFHFDDEQPTGPRTETSENILEAE